MPAFECMPKRVSKYAQEHEMPVTKCPNCVFREPCKEQNPSTWYLVKLTGVSKDSSEAWKKIIGEITLLPKTSFTHLRRHGFSFEILNTVKIQRYSMTPWGEFFPKNKSEIIRFLEKRGIDSQEAIEILKGK